MVRLTAGRDLGELLSLPSQEISPPASGSSRGARVAWFSHAWDTPVTQETRQATETAARALADRGFRLERIELRELQEAPAIWWLMFGVCLKTLIESSVPNDYRLHPLAYDAMATDEDESRMSYKELLAGWVKRDMLRMKLAERMRRFPLLLCPVAAIPAFRHGERHWEVDGETVDYPRAFVYSQVFNLLGVPAASVPVGRTRGGLPIGVQIVGRPNEDLRVLDAARELAAGLGQP